jgi:hypothetical protein
MQNEAVTFPVVKEFLHYPQETRGPFLLERATTRVVVEFWGKPGGFAALGLPRKGSGQVDRGYPFLRGV